MRKISILFVLIAGIFSLTSCLKDDEGTYPDAAGVAVVNAYPIESNLYFLIGGRELPNYAGQYKTYTGFYAIPGNKNFKVFNGLSNELLIDTTMNFVDSLSYATFVYGEAGKPMFLRAKDEALKDLGTKSAARFFHFGNKAGKVNLSIDNQDITAFKNRVRESSQTVENTEKFQVVNSGTYTITVTDETGRQLVKKENVEFQAGKYVNIMLLGTLDDNKFPLELGVIY
ncbi:hypothetical protein GCM10022216_20270 [Sphingobacterium kyonggiense]|uniref:DUF4397 domain-containing protein n=1 Tax=Sphingobacterium kyonggiense TaxID=714075 RepID=A0ABP7YTQ7_9SPHI